MINLLRKDLILLKKSKGLYIAAGFAVLGALMWQKNTFYFLWSMMTSTYFSLGYINSYDHRYDSEKIFNSLSLKRSTIVVSKYVSAILFLVIAVVTAIITMYLTKILYLGNATKLINLSQIAIVIMLVAVYISAYLPLYYRFGYMSSRWANFAALIMMLSFSGIIANSNIQDQSLTGKYLGFFIEAIRGNTGINRGLVIAFLALLILAISITISVNIYRKKEF